jgi:hypothetical protein
VDRTKSRVKRQTGSPHSGLQKAGGRARIGFYDALTTNDAQMRDKRHREKIAAGVVEADATIMANERISGSE